MTRLLPLLVAGLLAACGSSAPPPDWQMNARGAMDRALSAYLDGNTRVATVELDRARSEVSRTGRADMLARTELMQCAAQVASLVTGPCERFEALRSQAAPAEAAYAGYLQGQVNLAQAALLPEAHRSVAQALATPGAADLAPQVQALADPLARLVAAGAAFQAGRASPALLALAVDTASAQGWRRALLAWLDLSAQAADKAGDTATAALARQRIALVTREGRP
ncbi:hypothetical protein BurJ1DRAFT_0572 [Burkholderiales bacterium JOSHI_001]|nr:hypothetical protein BurJ1DRAFT_0572 [Burkholderiales bacterium JOSHI_001]